MDLINIKNFLSVNYKASFYQESEKISYRLEENIFKPNAWQGTCMYLEYIKALKIQKLTINKPNNVIGKWEKYVDFYWRGCIDGRWVHEKMFNITRH